MRKVSFEHSGSGGWLCRTAMFCCFRIVQGGHNLTKENLESHNETPGPPSRARTKLWLKCQNDELSYGRALREGFQATGFDLEEIPWTSRLERRLQKVWQMKRLEPEAAPFFQRWSLKERVELHELTLLDWVARPQGKPDALQLEGSVMLLRDEELDYRRLASLFPNLANEQQDEFNRDVQTLDFTHRYFLKCLKMAQETN